MHSAAEVSITLSDFRPVERGFFIACGGTSSFREERCQLKWTIHFQKHILIDCFAVFSSQTEILLKYRKNQRIKPLSAVYLTLNKLLRHVWKHMKT